MNKFGEFSENIACDYLLLRGMEILDRNFRTKYGEIDIIARELADNIIVFVEVKARTSFNFGLPEESITNKKKRKIIKSSFFYLQEKKLEHQNIRFDVIAIKKDKDNFVIKHIKNAFDQI